MKEILRELGMIARMLDSIANIEFKGLELTKGQYLYLVRICENPGIIQEQIIELIKVDRSTATRAIQKLEKNGLIEKKEDYYNKKNKKLYPSEKGKLIYPIIKKENEYSELTALSGFSNQEIVSTQIYLKRIRENLEKDWEYVKKGNQRNY